MKGERTTIAIVLVAALLLLGACVTIAAHYVNHGYVIVPS